jgi:NFU1 iron-sulfur cluster scaffold homolog, mitochondrial
MPKIAEIEETPNPNALKFALREPLSWGVPHSYESAAQAEGDALARALFAIEHVSNVFYVDRWLTVTQDGGADWKDLVRRIAVPLRAAPGAGARSATTIAAARAGFEHLSERDQGRLDAINRLLDEQVRPYLQGDGGDLHILALEGDRLVVHYQGACGTCPSSISGTLRGIESLVRTIEPELEVVAG